MQYKSESERSRSPVVVLGVTGASGAIYAVRLLEELLAAGCRVHVSISPSGRLILQQELGLTVDLERFRSEQLLPLAAELPEASPLRQFGYRGRENLNLAEDGAKGAARHDKPRDGTTGNPLAGRLAYHHHGDFMAPIASGSHLTDGMAVCPASGGTVSAIAHGSSPNLICRAADVHLKERRKLILMPRETPLSLIQLDNMRRCVEAGAVMLPAMPGFYHGVKNLAGVVDFVVARLLDQLGVQHNLMRRWGSEEERT